MKNTRKVFEFAVIAAIVINAALLLARCDNGSSNKTNEDQTPTTQDFDIGNLSQLQGKEIIAVTITAKPGKTSGEITDIRYNGSETLPTESGAYNVTFNVAEASGWKAANGLSAGIFIIFEEHFNIIHSIDDLTTFLSENDNNDHDTPYYIAIRIDNQGDFADLNQYVVNGNALGKYVYLDLSGSTITTIPDSAFYYPFERFTALTGITIPNSVTTIGERAFAYCTSLTNITIPNSVTNIGKGTFLVCTSLVSVTIPNSVTSIGEQAFASSGLTSITIPDSVISIGEHAFAGSGLTSVTIPDNVTSIGEQAFGGCTDLTAITVDSGNLAYSSENGVLYDKNKNILIQYPAGKTGEFTIPNSVTSIGNYAFGFFENLTSITIPNSVTNIESFAFASCENLTSVTIGSGVTTIGDGAFVGCTSLTSINIPNSVTSIGVGAFQGTSLTDITIPNSVTTIWEGAFSYCDFLENITIPNSVTTIGRAAFRACISLTSVTIPDSVTNIGILAFCECTGLVNITIPNSVTSIGSQAFYGCTSLASVTFEGTIPSTGFDTGAFPGDLRDEFYATDPDNGTPGTYTTTAPVDSYSVWEKQP